MPDLATPTAILTGLKTASEITKTLSQSDLNLERAELKNKMAELLETLAAVRLSAVELKDELQEKAQEIARLHEAMALKTEVIKSGDAYFKKDSDGKPTGDAFCLHCWETRKTLAHLVLSHAKSGPDQMVCHSCKNPYSWVDIGWPASR